ncbi:MAG: sugar ABC transporter permease [Armatimonadota bacterium]|nr:sugar ABC transporter permease [Armatimonadota bacterium]MDR7531454.1 sugar ABC transporter permease [Armatimonadota bacterium]MDR7566350.1 sugar ABC transporter permease [Armatimonadota bacterium]MDR7607377.1 sugar ABC transporter permease [Armatimonadota bacterium]MDR7615595.1 sugar ABC transporter permease [Armatimonadota bacterium]
MSWRARTVWDRVRAGAPAEASARVPSRGLRRLLRAGEVVLFLAPFAAFWLLFRLGPVLYGVGISLYRWDPLGDVQFVGVSNYLRLAADRRFWNALRNTLAFAALTVPGILALGVGLALTLFTYRGRPATRWVEAAFFFPYLLNVSVVGLVWRWLLDPDFGAVLLALRSLGLRPPVFLNEPAWALPSIAFATAWWLAGYRMVIFRAALEDIPEEIFDAAKVDGATGWRLLRSVLLPLLKPAALFALVLTGISGFIVFGQVLIMTAGGPGRASEVLALYLYRFGFEYLEMGQAAAVGVVIFALILSLTLLSFRWLGYGSAG